jgi:hypothetical protein
MESGNPSADKRNVESGVDIVVVKNGKNYQDEVYFDTYSL